MVNGFTYLGSTITVDGEIREEVKCRIGRAARAFGCLRQSISLPEPEPFNSNKMGSLQGHSPVSTPIGSRNVDY